jgi:hypothetical protein
MTTIAILHQRNDSADAGYRAIAGSMHSEGRTAGQALDALTSKLGEPQDTTLVILQPCRPDPLFSAVQQKRLDELMTRWRDARDGKASMTPGEQEELDRLVNDELCAAKQRAQTMVDGLAS